MRNSLDYSGNNDPEAIRNKELMQKQNTAMYEKARADYENRVISRSTASAPEAEAPAVAASPSGSEIASKGLSSPEAEKAAAAAGQGDGLGAVGSGMMAAGAATANPYLMAGGLAVKVVASGEEKKRANEEKQRLEYNDRITKRQQMLSQIGQIRIE